MTHFYSLPHNRLGVCLLLTSLLSFVFSTPARCDEEGSWENSNLSGKYDHQLWYRYVKDDNGDWVKRDDAYLTKVCNSTSYGYGFYAGSNSDWKQFEGVPYITFYNNIGTYNKYALGYIEKFYFYEDATLLQGGDKKLFTTIPLAHINFVGSNSSIRSAASTLQVNLIDEAFTNVMTCTVDMFYKTTSNSTNNIPFRPDMLVPDNTCFNSDARFLIDPEMVESFQNDEHWARLSDQLVETKDFRSTKRTSNNIHYDYDYDYTEADYPQLTARASTDETYKLWHIIGADRSAIENANGALVIPFMQKEGNTVHQASGIWAKAFENYTELKTLSFEEGNLAQSPLSGFFSIGREAFAGCTNLSEVNLTNTSLRPAQIKLGKNAFGAKTPENFAIYVPDNMVDEFRTADGWKDYADCIRTVTPPFTLYPSFDPSLNPSGVSLYAYLGSDGNSLYTSQTAKGSFTKSNLTLNTLSANNAFILLNQKKSELSADVFDHLPENVVTADGYAQCVTVCDGTINSVDDRTTYGFFIPAPLNGHLHAAKANYYRAIHRDGFKETVCVPFAISGLSVLAQYDNNRTQPTDRINFYYLQPGSEAVTADGIKFTCEPADNYLNGADDVQPLPAGFPFLIDMQANTEKDKLSYLCFTGRDVDFISRGIANDYKACAPLYGCLDFKRADEINDESANLHITPLRQPLVLGIVNGQEVFGTPQKALMPYRCYLNLNELPQSAQHMAIRLIITNKEGEVTSIAPVDANAQQQTSNVVFDLFGRRVNTMQPGHVYIVNGQKVVK